MKAAAPDPSHELSASTELVASVIVPVRNGGAHLGELLAALAWQTIGRDRFEVVIGDDGSTDRSTEELATADGWVRVVTGPPLNSYAARNRAAALARAPVLAFCDADCRPEPGWLEAGLRALERADLAGGLIRWRVPERPTVWTLLDIDLHVDPERAVRNGKCLGGNLFVRRELFERLDGFDEALPGFGDSDFGVRCTEAGARLVFAPEAVVSHPTHDRAKPFLRKVWSIHDSAGVREGRVGHRPRLLTRSIVPIVGMARSRRSVGSPLRLDRARLEFAGVRVGLRDDLRALPILYLVLPYLARVSRFRGRLKGRRESRA